MAPQEPQAQLSTLPSSPNVDCTLYNSCPVNMMYSWIWTLPGAANFSWVFLWNHEPCWKALSGTKDQSEGSVTLLWGHDNGHSLNVSIHQFNCKSLNWHEWCSQTAIRIFNKSKLDSSHLLHRTTDLLVSLLANASVVTQGIQKSLERWIWI